MLMEQFKAKGISIEEYQSDYDRRKGINSGGGQQRNSDTSGFGRGDSTRGEHTSGREGEAGRSNGGYGKGGPSHYGPGKSNSQADTVTVSCILCHQIGHLATSCPIKHEQAYNTEIFDNSKIVNA